MTIVYCSKPLFGNNGIATSRLGVVKINKKTENLKKEEKIKKKLKKLKKKVEFKYCTQNDQFEQCSPN